MPLSLMDLPISSAENVPLPSSFVSRDANLHKIPHVCEYVGGCLF